MDNDELEQERLKYIELAKNTLLDQFLSKKEKEKIIGSKIIGSLPLRSKIDKKHYLKTIVFVPHEPFHRFNIRFVKVVQPLMIKIIPETIFPGIFPGIYFAVVNEDKLQCPKKIFVKKRTVLRLYLLPKEKIHNIVITKQLETYRVTGTPGNLQISEIILEELLERIKNAVLVKRAVAFSGNETREEIYLVISEIVETRLNELLNTFFYQKEVLRQVLSSLALDSITDTEKTRITKWLQHI